MDKLGYTFPVTEPETCIVYVTVKVPEEGADGGAEKVKVSKKLVHAPAEPLSAAVTYP